MTHVLVVDPHPIVRAGLTQLLTAAWPSLMVAEAGQADVALQLNRSGQWDVTVMDPWIDPNAGLSLLQQLRSDAPRRPVLVFSASHDSEMAIRAIRAGASGFVGKETDPEEILAAITRVAAGRRVVPDWLSEMLALRLCEVDVPAHTRLSDREFQVLRLLGSGRTGREAAAMMHISHKTVATYRARLLEKLHLRNSVELAGYAVKQGLTSDS
jgi:two-component system invasion response regulator UvrY